MEFRIMYLSTTAVLCLFLMHDLVCGQGEPNLRQHLHAMNDDKLVRPVREASDVVPVEVQLTPMRLREVDDEHHLLTLDAWLLVAWKDAFLSWDPKDYGGLEELRLPPTEVWLPDLVIYSGTPDTAHLPVNTNVVIGSDGTILWAPYFTVKNSCPSLRYTNLRANCTISLLSWTYDVAQLDINIRNETNMEYLEKGFPGWYVESTTTERILKYFSCCPKPYAVINFYIALRRRVF